MALRSAIEVVAVGPVAGAAVAWREKGQLGVTVLAKATFSFAPRAAMSLALPLPIVRADHHYDRWPAKSVEAASDLAVYKPWCDVTLVGHAHAPPGRPQPAMAVRLGVFRGQTALLDKTLRVFGDRDLRAGSAPAPFQAMPIVYERAARSEDNPVGVEAGSTKAPNVLDPRGPNVLAGFGPIARLWASRRKLAKDVRVGDDAGIVDYGDAFAWEYFQVAPADQRIGFLRGDEWIVLDGMHPALPRLETQIPNARAAAKIASYAAGSAPSVKRLNLVADTLAIDADRGIASITWRARFPVSDDAALATLRAAVGVELPNAPIAWPDLTAMSPPSPSAPEPEPPSRNLGSTSSTVMIDPDFVPQKPATPFEPRPSEPRREPPPFAPPIEEEPELVTEQLQARKTAPPARPNDTLSDTGTFAPGSPDPTPFPIAPPASRDAPMKSTSVPWNELRASVQRPLEEQEGTIVARKEDIEAASAAPASRFFHEKPLAEETAPLGEQTAPLSAKRDERPRDVTPPKRRSHAVPTICPPSLAMTTLAWQVKPPEDSLTIVVKATCDIVPDELAKIRDESDPPIGDVHEGDDETKPVVHGSDYAIFKPKVDVTLVGKAYAPGGGARAANVELAIGTIKKRVAVVGDRTWKSAEPAVFVSMPLTLARAFGGPKHDKNPLGVGHKNAGDGVMPNLEDPDHLVTSPSDSVGPACFAPLPISFPERAAKMGSYGGRYLKTRWPYFPEDFDYHFFQNAPPSQQLASACGDEEFSIVGVRPDVPKLEGRLPCVRARAFLDRVDGRFEEVVLKLDTIAFDTEAMKLELVWRGMVPVSDEEAPEINAVFAFHEPLDAAPISLAEARDKYLAHVVPLEEVEEELETSVLRANDTAPPPEGDDEVDRGVAKLEAEMEAREKALREELKKSGVDVDAPPPAMEPPSPDAIAKTMREAGASEEDVAELLQALKPPSPETAPPPRDADVRAKVVAMLEAGEPLEGLDLEGADLSDLDFSSTSLAGSSFKDAKLARANLSAAKLAGALLAGADLSSADLSGADLEGADATGANLEAANLTGAKLGGADLSKTRARGAIFEGAEGKGTQLVESDLSGARFDRCSLEAADLTRATLDRASFKGANMPSVRLYDARGEEVILDEANMKGARAEGARLVRSSAKNADFSGAVFESAELHLTTFFGAKLEGASLERAKCEEAVFTACDLREARFRRAKLTRSVFLKANAMHALFERADLSFCDLRGANLHACEVWRAKLDGAKLDLAIVTRSKLSKGPWTP